MNKIYDKLLLAVGVLALLGGVGFYMMKSGDQPSSIAQVGQPADNPYQAIPVPVSVETQATWPDAVETSKQPPLELYDVFTPPAIWVDNDGIFIFKSPIIAPNVPIPFGLYLAKIERDPYRIQLEGYIEEDLSDASKSLLLLFDEEQQKRVRARVGQEEAESEFKLVNFTIERVRDADGNISKIVIATLLDQRLGEEVTLTHGERLYNDSTTVVLRSHEDPTVLVQVSEVPNSFVTTAGEYVLEEINLEESSVTVKKLGTDELEPETKQLYLSSSNEETITPKVIEPKADAADAAFDFVF